jgi:hypothetical protein
MKKILSIFSILTLCYSLSFAAEPLNYDPQKLNSEFEQLNKIEQYVQNNEGTTLESLKNNPLLENVKIADNASSSIVSGELPGGIPAFWWGCVLSWVGLILVYVITDKDNAQTKKALLGCLVSGGLYILWWVFVVAIGGRNFWF